LASHPKIAMRCSVVIPTLNEAGTIEKTLRRLDRLAPHEVIVADGGSADGTVELARPHTTVVPGRRGRGPQLNAGAARATGDVLLFLHADVRLPVDALSAIEFALSDHEVMGGCFRVRFGGGAHEALVAACYDLLRFRGQGAVYGDASIFVRREAYERLGGFRDYPIMEDVNFVSRLRRVGRVVELPQIVVPSARRWRRGGRRQAWAAWWALQLLYGLGASPHWLGRFYGAVR
jgi:rSAM/selenodomain-associated transferase 2